MIDPDEPKTIRFSPGDVPELPDILQEEIEASREAERRRKEDNLRWLEEHCDWRPIGGEW